MSNSILRAKSVDYIRISNSILRGKSIDYIRISNVIEYNRKVLIV